MSKIPRQTSRLVIVDDQAACFMLQIGNAEAFGQDKYHFVTDSKIKDQDSSTAHIFNFEIF